MKKRAILIDGNNLLFRSYYATAYNNNFMNNSNGFPTNALFGLCNMLNKIINEEKPEYIMCAFDKGKNFRHDLYKEYKAGRIETPNELKKQFPIAKELCEALGIKYIDFENYEADDIIGTFARMADEDKNYNATIISSDKDLLQLISDEVDVKLLKQKGYEVMNTNTFYDYYKVSPIRMIDLKALMGDASDNIPGVKGIGEKTAISLLSKYENIDNLYNHLDELTKSNKEKLINGKESAYYSKNIATICKNIPSFNYTFNDIKYNGPDTERLIKLYKTLEFNSFLKQLETNKKLNNNIEYKIVKEKINLTSPYSIYIELDNPLYYKSNIYGASIYDGKNLYYLDMPSILLNRDLFINSKITFDLKKNKVSLSKYNIKTNSDYDTMIISYILGYNTKDDISYLSRSFGFDIEYYDNMFNTKNKLDDEDIIKNICLKAKFLYESFDELINKLKEKELYDLYINIEHPLIDVLSNMEESGIRVNSEYIDSLNIELNNKLKILEEDIYTLAGEKFNISSPKQLGNILYDKLLLPNSKGKNKNSTSHEVLIKFRNMHPIVDKVLEYRNINKLLTTYIVNFNDFVCDDNKIHTIFKQNVTRTGRLSSVNPNLQNIPVRSLEGKLIRKAFIPEKDSVLLSSDYSQIELRVLADITDSKALKEAFINGEDIHRHVASDIFNKPEEDVTDDERRIAKSVIFGIVYGISGYGLGENLNISLVDAKKYIDKYLEMYPEVKEYMSNIISFAKENGYVKTLLGRIRVIEEIKNTNYLIRNMGERIALNTPIQGTAADIIKIAMIRMQKALKDNNLKSKILLQVHDELIFNVPECELEIVKKLVKETMENAYNLSVPLKVEINYGKTWYDAK